MFIKIPVRHHKYIRMFVEAKCFDDEGKARTFIFEDGLSEAESDICMGSPEPDMSLSFLEGKSITIELLDSTDYQKRLEFIGQGFNVTLAKATTISFLLGLFNQCLLLKSSMLYQENKRFRRTISEMPHEWCYDQPASKSEDEYSDE